MEKKRLYFYIMYPAMILTWLFGMAINSFSGIELLFVFMAQIKFALFIFDNLSLLFGHCLRSFNQGENNNSPKF